MKKNLNDSHQNEDMNKVKIIQIYAHISGVKSKEYQISANGTSKRKIKNQKNLKILLVQFHPPILYRAFPSMLILLHMHLQLGRLRTSNPWTNGKKLEINNYNFSYKRQL